MLSCKAPSYFSETVYKFELKVDFLLLMFTQAPFIW